MASENFSETDQKFEVGVAQGRVERNGNLEVAHDTEIK